MLVYFDYYKLALEETREHSIFVVFCALIIIPVTEARNIQTPPHEFNY